jgi:hypothetical protein
MSALPKLQFLTYKAIKLEWSRPSQHSFIMEAPEETVISYLHSLSSYGTIAVQETFKALTNPENVPIFLSSLVKFSLGPTLAFLWGRRAFKQDEAFKDAKEAEAVKTMLRVEIDINLERIECLIKQFSYLVEVVPQDKVKAPKSISPHGLQTQAFDKQISALAKVLEPQKLQEVFQTYGDFRALIYAYENLQPMVIENWGEPEINDCRRTLQHLRQAEKHISNPLK